MGTRRSLWVVAAFVVGAVVVGGGARHVVAVDPTVRPVPFFEFDVTFVDVAADPTRDVFYASLYGNTPGPVGIATIDSVTGEVLSTTDVGSQPFELAVAHDGSALFVGLTYPGRVAKYSLPDMTLLWTHVFRIDDPWNPTTDENMAADIEASPDDADLVVVSTRWYLPGHPGVVAIRGGVALADSVPQALFPLRLEFGASGSVVYGWENGPPGTTVGLWELALDGDGVTGSRSLSINVDGSDADIRYFDGHVYSGDGYVVDTSSSPPTLVGMMPSTDLERADVVAVDQDARLVHYVDVEFEFPTDAHLAVYDHDTGQLAELWELPAGILWPSELQVVSDGVLVLIHATRDAVLLYPGGYRGSYGEFTAVTPARVLDTRSGIGTGGVVGPLGPRSSIDVQITGVGGVPATGVDAVVMTVTAVAPTEWTYLSVYPRGLALPNISILNTTSGDTRPNLATVPVGDGGQVTVYNWDGTTHVLFDVAGFYTDGDGPDGARFRPIDPVRIADTRHDIGGIGSTPFGPDETRTIRVTGHGGVPVSGPTAVVLNVTVDAATAWSYLTVSPADVVRPIVSNLNYTAGDTVANQVVVRVPADGMIDIYNAFGTATVIVDLVGYYEDAGAEDSGRLWTFAPFRQVDTRVDQLFPPPGSMGDGDQVHVWWEDPFTATVVNVTVTETQVGGYIVTYPFPGDPPATSTVNYGIGETVANHAIVRCGPEMAFLNVRGTTHLIVDIFGVFT